MLCLFPIVMWVGLQCVIVAVTSHTHLLFKLTVSIQFLKVVQQEQQKIFLMMSIVICMSSKRILDYESDTEINRQL